MEFRSKSPRAFAQEVLTWSSATRCWTSPSSTTSSTPSSSPRRLPIIAERGYDLRMFLRDQVEHAPRAAEDAAGSGRHRVQPGIENLSAHVLKIMDKGVTGCLNVRLLRDAGVDRHPGVLELPLRLPWRGGARLPSVLEQLPALHHLPPPDGAGRIAIERFSPYFDKPELGFAQITPARMYPVIYDLPERELRDLAYIFESPRLASPERSSPSSKAAIPRWREAYFEGQSTLTYRVIDGRSCSSATATPMTGTPCHRRPRRGRALRPAGPAAFGRLPGRLP